MTCISKLKHLPAATAVALLGIASPLFAAPVAVATGEYPPYLGAELPCGRLANGMLEQIANTADLDLSFDFMPWKRSFELLRRGDHNILSFWSEIPDADGLVKVGPVVTGRMTLFHLADTPIPKFDHISDVSGLTIGTIKGFTYDPDFWAHVESGAIDVDAAQTDVANMKKLLAGRIDAVIIDELVGRATLLAHFSAEDQAKIVISDSTIVNIDSFFWVAASEASGQSLATQLQATFDSMVENGDWDRLWAAQLAAAGLSAWPKRQWQRYWRRDWRRQNPNPAEEIASCKPAMPHRAC